MEIEYENKKLEALESNEAASETKYSIALIKAFQNKLVLLRSAPDERTLRNWKSLHFEKLKGERKGQYSIRLNDQWRLIIELDDETSPKKIRLLAIEDYH